MIATKNEHVTTRITICNYAKYDPKQSHSGEQAATDNNDKNVYAKSSFSKSEFKSFEQLSSEQAQQALLAAGKEFLGDGKK